MSNRWMPAVVVIGVFAVTAVASDKDRTWSASFPATGAAPGNLTEW